MRFEKLTHFSSFHRNQDAEHDRHLKSPTFFWRVHPSPSVFNLCEMTGLLRYNSYTKQGAHLKCANQWFLVYSRILKYHHNQLSAFLTPQEETPYPLAVTPHLPSPFLYSLPPTTTLFSASIDLPIYGHFIYMKPYIK